MFYLGLDLGWRVDHSALALIEKLTHPLPFLTGADNTLRVRALERLPLGTPFRVVVEVIRRILKLPEVEIHGCRLAVDATGLGGPVVQMLKDARLDCWMTPVTITGGQRQRSGRGSNISVPKTDLIAGVQVALEKRELLIAKGMRSTGTLVRELMDVRFAARTAGGMRIGADGYGQHDDLVIALALAIWRSKRV